MNRSIYCYDCKAVKENPKSGYCKACSKIRYDKRFQPHCYDCDALKENPRDSYCNQCKREKLKKKSRSLRKRKKNSHGLGRSIFCSKCKKEKEPGRHNESCCIACKREMKKLRTKTPEQIFKDSVRKFTWHKIRKGDLIKLPCEVCGTNEKVEAHHDDYSKPLDVRWLCRKHHQEHHRFHVEHE